MLIVMQSRTYIGLASLALTSACGFNIPGGSGTPDDATGSDGNAGDAASICPWPYEAEYATPCPAKTGPAIELVTGDAVLDTDAGTLTSGPVAIDILGEVIADVFVVWTTGLTIGTEADLRVTGSLPVVFISTGAITIDGDLDGAGDADSPVVGDNPAGANPPECDAAPAGPGQPCAAEGASGGGGGSFALVGGQGGGGGSGRNCAAAGTGPVPGGTFGEAVMTRPPNLRGGCAGGAGGESLDNGAAAGRAGSGGGAIALVARETITISGVVNVGGAGGGGGKERSGGGGGGSGGMIVLEATTITITIDGRVAANGGGGGGGADGGTADEGSDGEDSVMPAGGGAKAGSGTDGGKGGARADAAQAATISGRGGGGGGGGVGFVRIHSLSGATADPMSVSPAPSP